MHFYKIVQVARHEITALQKTSGRKSGGMTGNLKHHPLPVYSASQLRQSTSERCSESFIR
jgi:hypothetical protein